MYTPMKAILLKLWTCPNCKKAFSVHDRDCPHCGTRIGLAARVGGKAVFFLKKTNINGAVAECRRTPGAILLDVREAGEFRSGHIPGAMNVPLSVIETIALPKDRPLYVYCLRGTRSRRAVGILKRKGYDARSIGGIASYKGELER